MLGIRVALSLAALVVAASPLAATATVEPTGRVTVVASGLRAPWSIAFVGRTALISERDTGRILELRGNGSTRLVGKIPGVVHRDESGLLGLAVDARRRLYAYSTGADGNRIQRFPVLGRAGSLRLGRGTTLLAGLPSGSFHNGGRLAFGPDGMLYATVGDAGVPERAQDLGSKAGKILRMTPAGGVPADNPFRGSRVYSYGHRNVQGIAWSSDGTMFASEFGLDTWDELNVIVAGGNYGWPLVEGRAGKDFIDPVQQWRPDIASPSGIAIIRDSIFITNLRGERLRVVPVTEPSRSKTFYGGRFGRLRAAAAAPDGSLWFLTNNTDGRGAPSARDDRILRVRLG